jgi:Spy/CpxP family protein refolding chaperone
MSKIRAAAMSAAAVFGLAVYAGAQVPAKADSTWHRGARQAQAGEHGRGGHGRGQFAHRGGERHFMKDLNLTDAQKTKVKAIHQKYRPQLEAMRKQAEPQFKAMRDARQKGDTSAATRARFRTQMEQFRTRSQSIRQQEQNEIRGILTADQRTKWDAAQKKMNERQGKMKKKFGDRRG